MNIRKSVAAPLVALAAAGLLVSGCSSDPSPAQVDIQPEVEVSIAEDVVVDDSTSEEVTQEDVVIEEDVVVEEPAGDATTDPAGEDSSGGSASGESVEEQMSDPSNYETQEDGSTKYVGDEAPVIVYDPETGGYVDQYGNPIVP